VAKMPPVLHPHQAVMLPQSREQGGHQKDQGEQKQRGPTSEDAEHQQTDEEDNHLAGEHRLTLPLILHRRGDLI